MQDEVVLTSFAGTGSAVRTAEYLAAARAIDHVLVLSDALVGLHAFEAVLAGLIGLQRKDD
jgi:hypothetical protein